MAKKAVVKGHIALSDNAKTWESATNAVEWILYRASKAVTPLAGVFCFSAMIDGDESKTKFSVFDFGKRAAIYIESKESGVRTAHFLEEDDMKNWEIVDD